MVGILVNTFVLMIAITCFLAEEEGSRYVEDFLENIRYKREGIYKSISVKSAHMNMKYKRIYILSL